MFVPGTRQCWRYEEKGMVPCPSMLVANPHPPLSARPDYRRIHSGKPVQQNCFYLPPIREAQTAVEHHLVGLMLFGYAEKLVFPFDQTGIRKMKVLFQGFVNFQIGERTGGDVAFDPIKILKENPGLTPVSSQKGVSVAPAGRGVQPACGRQRCRGWAGRGWTGGHWVQALAMRRKGSMSVTYGPAILHMLVK